MRRWALAATVVLVVAALLMGSALSPMGSEPRSATPVMTQLGLVLLDGDAGLYVLGVMDGSLASRAGIEPGDYLTSARGLPLTAATQLEEILSGQEAAPSLPLTVSRDERLITVNLPIR